MVLQHARKSCWSAPVFYRPWIRMESMHLAKAIERIDSLWILQRDLGTIAAVYVAAYSSSIRNDVIGNLVKLCFVVESEILVLSWSTQNIYKIER